MKRNLLFLSLVSLFVISCSTVESLYSISEDEKDWLFNRDLIGKWKQKGETAEFIVDTVSGWGGKIYELTVVDTSEKEFADTSRLFGRLIRLGKSNFLDCSAEMDYSSFSQLGPWTVASLLPKHAILKIHMIDQNSLVFSPIDPEQVLLLVKQKKIQLRYEAIEEENLLLLHKPLSLQKKLLELEKFPQVYKERTTLNRE